jgi:hypothetical protein
MESRRSEDCRDYDPDKYDGFGRDNCHRELSARYPIDAIVEGGARLPDNLGGTSNMPCAGYLTHPKVFYRTKPSHLPPFWL